MAKRVWLRWEKREHFTKALLGVVPEAEKELADANQISAQALVDLAQRLAPVGKDSKNPGTLRDSIRMQPGDRPGSWVVQAGGPTTTHPVRKGARATYDYALGVEFGTEKHGSAQPFFWPSFRVNKRPAKARATRALTKAIKQQGFKTNG